MPKLAFPSLKITPFTNPSGAVVFRLSGNVGAERVRKNFHSRAEAEAELSRRLKTKIANGPRPVVTSLSETAVREAEAASVRLPVDTDLVQAVDFFRRHYRPLDPVSLVSAIAHYKEHLLHERKNEEVTADQSSGVLTQFANFAVEFDGTKRSDRITEDLARSWIFAVDGEGQPIPGVQAVSPRTQRDRFDLLNRFCAYLVKRQRSIDNPITALNRPKVRVLPPAVFNFDQAWTLLQCALVDEEGPHTLPFFATCLLSGVRPEEYERLAGEDFYLEGDHPVIEVNKAKGGQARRNVELSDALTRILKECRAREIPLGGAVSRRKFNRVRRAAKLFAIWANDIMRHTYASHEYARTRDSKALAGNMGNSERVLFQNYIRPVPKADAVKFRGLILNWKPTEKPKKYVTPSRVKRGDGG